MSPRIIDGLTELRSLVGHKMGTSDWLEIPQSMIDSFAELTLDQQWIHIDTERAKHESPYGTTIALGFLTAWASQAGPGCRVAGTRVSVAKFVKTWLFTRYQAPGWLTHCLGGSAV